MGEVKWLLWAKEQEARLGWQGGCSFVMERAEAEVPLSPINGSAGKGTARSPFPFFWEQW